MRRGRRRLSFLVKAERDLAPFDDRGTNFGLKMRETSGCGMGLAQDEVAMTRRDVRLLL